MCVARKTLVLFSCTIYLLCCCILPCALTLLFELTPAFSLYADNMLGQGKLAELRALARTHGLATGSQTVPNSVVEIAVAQGRSPPKGPAPSDVQPAAQRKKLVLKRPKRKAPQVIHEEEEEDDEATEDGLVTKRKRVAPSSPPAPPPLPTSTPPSTLLLHHRHPHKLLFHQSKRSRWPLRHPLLRSKSQTSWRTPRAPPRHMYQLEGVPLQMPQPQRLLQSGMRSLIPHRF